MQTESLRFELRPKAKDPPSNLRFPCSQQSRVFVFSCWLEIRGIRGAGAVRSRFKLSLSSVVLALNLISLYCTLEDVGVYLSVVSFDRVLDDTCDMRVIAEVSILCIPS